MNDEAWRAWCEEHDVELDADGFPRMEAESGPPVQCDLCGDVAECPTRPHLHWGDRIHRPAMCSECVRLQFTDGKRFWQLIDAYLSKQQVHGAFVRLLAALIVGWFLLTLVAGAAVLVHWLVQR